MPHAEIDVSYVLTVYNKAAFLPFTIHSLLKQEGNLRAEYVFVDDVSTDASLAVIEEATKGIENVIIIRNQHNRGPSVRLNQGVRAASGTYVMLMDSDDILPKNAALNLSNVLNKEQADCVYGRWKKTGLLSEKLMDERMEREPAYTVSTTPLEYVLQGRFVRMTLMVRRDLFLKAGGCDERIFIQDESLPLRLSYHASRFIDMHAAVVLVPKEEGNLSRNKTQQHYDRFLAYRNALMDFPHASETAQILLFRRAVSSVWKHVRATHAFPFFSWVFFYYLAVRCLRLSPDFAMLSRLLHQFDACSSLRRMESQP